jgi:arginase
MAARPLHLFEAGVITEQRFAGLAEAPAALGPALAERLHPEKRIRVPFVVRDRLLTAAREACRTLADGIAGSLRAGASCVIVGGECTLVAGTLSGALAVEPDLHLVYVDAHGDFNTLATTPSHFIGGMCLAHVCGRSLAPLLWPGSRKIAEERVALVGARALDPGEALNLERSHVVRVPFGPDRPDAPGLLAFARGKRIWLHLDVDVIDPRELPAVSFPEPGGPSLAALREVMRALAAVAEIRGVELCAYDPRKDPGATLVAPLVELAAEVRAPVAI